MERAQTVTLVTPEVTLIITQTLPTVTPTLLPETPEAITPGAQVEMDLSDPEALVAAVVAEAAQAEVAVDNVNID